MDEFCNEVFLRGTLAGAPVFSHRGKTEEFFTFPLEIMRLSGTSDKINIIAGKALMDTVEITDGDFVEISGEAALTTTRAAKAADLL